MSRTSKSLPVPTSLSSPWLAAVSNQAGCSNGAGGTVTLSLGRNDKGGYGWSYALQADNGNGASSLDTAPGYSLASIAKHADTVIIGETGFVPNVSQASGWAMMAFDPRITATAAGFSQPGLFAQGRHNTEQTFTMQTMPVPIKGRLNCVFLDGHAKNLGLGQLFEVAPVINGVAVEDGVPLVNEDGVATANPGGVINHTRAHIRYKLLNID